MTVDLPALSLFRATPAQMQVALRRTWAYWGKGQTLAEHLVRDAQLPAELQLEGCTVVWVLAPRDAPTTVDFKCACRTFKRAGIVRVAGPGAPMVEDVVGYGIATLFTPPEYRGKGYARHLMRLLHWVLADEALLPAGDFPAAWGAPPLRLPGPAQARFSILYSDVGPTYYSACGPVPGDRGGWVMRGATTTVWDVASALPQADGLSQWTALDEAGVSKLWTEDAEKMWGDMKRGDAGLSFTFLPTHGVAAFQHRRLHILLDRLVKPPMTAWGAVSSTNTDAYATWTVDPIPPTPSTLSVTRIRADPDVFPDLVGHMVEVARTHNLQHVEVWNLPEQLEALARTLGARTFEREEHLPAFKWYGAESEEDVTWAFNERCTGVLTRCEGDIST
ncbi:hypothetical protein C8J57DRAFT_1457858 [Mycena rebaudengoi]|nr:hypothetical protein C8J57DRAFT_1457858 [Mycena rebaudengoi]